MFREFIYQLKRPVHLIKTGVLKGLRAEIKYGFPAKKLKIICITGTDGKTTSSTMLYHVLKAAGKKVALLSTVAAYIGNEEIDTGFHVTTPDPTQLQAFMARMVREGYEYLVLEATSHGIYQYRLWGVNPSFVGITNITNEHLDYHVNHDLYVEAKVSLASKATHVVANADDESSFHKIKRILKHTSAQVLPYSAQDKLPKVVTQAFTTRFPEAYNRMNARLVYQLAQLLDVPDKVYAQAITEFPGVPGRMQVVSEEKGVIVIVDFAHTANGLLQVLTNLRQKMDESKKKGRLIAVFGCAGLRDVGKRPVMGKTASELADLAVFTAEDPRTEDIWSIFRQMKSQIKTHHNKVISVADRREAIFYAIQKLAQPGDIVGIFGKGHEKSMAYGNKEYPWSDADVARDAIAARSN
jgi:UDP-N-acetylmuramoyl-L-alanyl-D-glutamate--2,6-diaminopimelate ligase